MAGDEWLNPTGDRSVFADLHPLFSPSGAVTRLLWRPPAGVRPEVDREFLNPVYAWLTDHFQGRFRPVDFPLDPRGTPFQQKVWRQLLTIPPGETATYGELAAAIGSAPRAVGGAVGRNPVPIIIPCHRVVAAAGLGGFSAPGGVATKKKLLRLEGWTPTNRRQRF